MNDLIKTYDPGNTNITEQELSAMKDLTDAQIAELAKAYPNNPRGNAYLVLWMTKEDANSQRFPLSTWGNIHNLRKMGHKDILPYTFRTNHTSQAQAQFNAMNKPAQRVVDLSKADTDNAEGIKKGHEAVNQLLKEIDEGKNDLNKDLPVPVSPELDAAQKELQQAIDDKAHHMTVKSLQGKVDELKK